ncbi:MerR family transcriptional regulator [uncultured Hymenobacter sp.]|uniref:MerR family transcriptional regulator n=1 Tax=uncultured Hymenobacter sp. TaxID=170016 RepID=UPI0035CA64EE
MGHYSISELEQLSGVKAHTIRIWEQRYGLLQPQRTSTNIRLYDDEALRHLLNVATLCGRGHRISKVAGMSPAERGRAVLDCYDDAHDHTARVNALVAAMIGFDEPRLSELLDEAAAGLGFEEALLYIAYPLLQRLGLSWQAGSIIAAHEHLISHLLRQKILAATNSLPPSVATGPGQGWVLFVPEGELHELALLFINYALRRRGQHTLYLGQNQPVEDLATVCEIYQPHTLLGVLTARPALAEVPALAAGLLAIRPGQQRLLLYGPLAQHVASRLPPGCVAPARMTDFLALIPNLKEAVGG